MNDLSELLKQFHDGAEGMADPVPKRANVWHKKMHIAYKHLRETDEGRAGIMALMEDANPHVRCSAAARSLAWDQKRARAVLETLRDFQGACSFDAEIILKEFDKGKLTFDY